MRSTLITRIAVESMFDVNDTSLPFFEKLRLLYHLCPEFEELVSTPELLNIKYFGIYYVVNIDISMSTLDMYDAWYEKLDSLG